jgi:hypothetical protein
MRSYHRSKKDDAQKKIELWLKVRGIEFADTSGLGDGFPDLVVAYRGDNILLEVKNSTVDPLTRKEKEFMDRWKGRGRYHIVCNYHDVARVLDPPQGM